VPDVPRHLDVVGLFGYLNPSVKLRTAERITILSGPNGSGKTHILRLFRHLVEPELAPLSQMPIVAATLEYESGKQLQVRRVASDESAELHFEGVLASGKRFESGPHIVPLDPLAGVAIPDYMERVSDELWADTRDGELVPTPTLISRFANRYRVAGGVATFASSPPEPEPLEPWVKEHFTAKAAPTFIATGRLDLPAPVVREGPTRVTGTGLRRARQPEAVGRIRQYVERIRAEVAEARRSSLAVSQRADQEFASRALDKARETVKEGELRARYERLAQLHRALHENGLTAESMGVEFPSNKTNPTERRILMVFLADWEDKLRPLEPVHRKLQLLREIVGEKLLGKTLVVENGEPHFVSDSGEPIGVNMLSSGEQHLLALFTMLLFYAQPGSLVLIDEPEISLHAAWKHAFLDDISRVAQINQLQVALATHSTAIVNSRWDLVEELAGTS
jgi:energy-coupling factor transporter ATP-binding protein EcfA2